MNMNVTMVVMQAGTAHSTMSLQKQSGAWQGLQHSAHLMPHMYSNLSKVFCMAGSWKNGTLGAVRGTSTDTCRNAPTSSSLRSQLDMS